MLKIKSILYNLFKVYQYSFGNQHVTYFKGDEKNKLQILLELLFQFITDGKFNYYYYTYALNMKGKNNSSFISKKEFFKTTNKINSLLKERAGISDIEYDIILKDKFYLGSILSANLISAIDIIGVIINSKFVSKNKDIRGIDQLNKIESPFVIKNTILEYNEGLLFCVIKDGEWYVNNVLSSKDELSKKLRYGIWIIQGIEISSGDIRVINSTALNTTRVYTILDDSVPEFLSAYQAFATGAEKTDSWGKGAIYVGFDNLSNTLHENGFFHPEIGREGLVKKHPDTKVEFKNYKVAHLNEAVELCKKAHQLFPNFFVIGWDVAITEQGVKIVEANEKPGINAIQCVDNNFKKKFIFFASKFLNNN